MAHNVKLGVAAANAEADAISALLNNGYLRLYSGTQPATANTAVTDQTLLAELRFNNPACEAAASNGTATFDITPAPQDASANADGTPTWGRLLKSDGTTVVMDATVGTSGTDIVIDASPIVAGATVTVQSATYTANRG